MDSDGDTRHCLDLFAGLGGFSAAFRDSDRWDVTTVDFDERFDVDVHADVFDLRPSDLPDADVVLASPPCNVFSKAAAWQEHWDASGAPRTDAARERVTLVFHTVGVIRGIAPDYWFLENPEGHLRRFLGRPTGSVTFCQYGTSYQKPTDLWGEHPPMTYRRCRAGDDCHDHGSLEDDRDQRPLPRDPAERAKVPRELSEAILNAVEGRSEQSTLTASVARADGGAEHGHTEPREDDA
jgi:hypothetical protein